MSQLASRIETQLAGTGAASAAIAHHTRRRSLCGCWVTLMTTQRQKRTDDRVNVAHSLDAFHRRFAPLFGRREAQDLSLHYLHRLLANSTHRSASSIAGSEPQPSARAVQRFLSDAPWPTEPLIDAIQREVSGDLQAPDGTFVVGEICFRKQGEKSVGVARQPCGGQNRIYNCQIGVFLAYASVRGQALLDARLYLPEQWTTNAERRRNSGVPMGLIYQSRQELAIDLLRRAQARRHFAGHSVTGADWFGATPALRDVLDLDGWRYIVGVPATTHVRSKRRQRSGPTAAPPTATVSASSRPERSAHFLDATLAADGWHELTVELGRGGRWPFHFAAQPVLEDRPGRGGVDAWLIVRRDLDGRHPHYYLSNAPIETPLTTLAQLASYGESTAALFTTETGTVGLGNYEVRSWAGWHHHMALALLLNAFLLHANASAQPGAA